ncbi:MAG TPA: UDP-N-acetylglucosamine 2-epimerase (non-hydrolyzing) [Bacteroidetes bacterium]|nr:UDP-N-acetylglucosamine 2-epimerase (non-hydrolyzing) [Bacteroidota bacterium]
MKPAHRIFNVVGARPQIIKSAALSRALREHYGGLMEEVMVHSGQHYDKKMSDVFFDEMGIPRPDHHLHVGSGTHGRQTGEMMRGMEDLILSENPRLVLVYGDTNTTLATALASAKLKVPVAHVEAGLRSYNKSMPEEINRVLCDHVSTLLFTPTRQAEINLAREGIVHSGEEPFDMDHPAVVHTGDVMFDNALYYGREGKGNSRVIDRLDIRDKPYVLVTLHRDMNTDDPGRLQAIMGTLLKLAEDEKITVVIPLHPRTRKMMAEFRMGKSMDSSQWFRITDPVSYLEMIALEKNARLIMTDSGGVQKEAHFFRKACIVFRKETEWVELVSHGTARLVDASPEKIREAWELFRNQKNLDFPPFYGEGNAASLIAGTILRFLEREKST